MMSEHLILSQFEARSWRKLLQGLQHNGVDVPAHLVSRLTEPSAGAIALGLRRLLELSFGLSRGALDMLRTLLDQQRPDGSWAGDPAPTAAAMAAIGACLVGSLKPSLPPDLAVRASLAQRRGLSALAVMQDDEGTWRHPGESSDRQTAGSACWIRELLSRDAEARQCLHLDPVVATPGSPGRRTRTARRAETSPTAVASRFHRREPHPHGGQSTRPGLSYRMGRAGWGWDERAWPAA
ncbi:MAG: hypothetical protein IT442_01040 [Phycisphaeraceae bacterium]|nr:hypothetical protein [Phycisphaeraceae bacterium]